MRWILFPTMRIPQSFYGLICYKFPPDVMRNNTLAISAFVDYRAKTQPIGARGRGVSDDFSPALEASRRKALP